MISVVTMPGTPSDGTRNVLVTGATGVLGHRLVARLADDGYDVRGLVRDDEGAALVERRGRTPVVGDVLEPASLESLDPPDVLVHAATAIPTSDRPTDEEWAHNDRVRFDGARNLVDAMGSHLEHVCFPSVVWLARQPDGSTFREDAVRHPDLATRSAAATEDFLQGTAEAQDVALTICRCGFFYAPDAAHTREWGERLLDRRLPIVGGGLLGRRDAELSFVHPDDAARAFAAVVDAGATGLYHVVDDEPVTPASFFETFADLLDAPSPRRIPGWLARFFVGEVAAETLTSPMPTTNEKLRETVDWEPRFPTYRQGLQAVVETWRDEGTIRATDDGYEWAG